MFCIFRGYHMSGTDYRVLLPGVKGSNHGGGPSPAGLRGASPVFIKGCLGSIEKFLLQRVSL